MKKYGTETIPVEIVVEITCNCCGNVIAPVADGRAPEYFSIQKEWGYGSPYDGELHEFDLCADCYDKIIKSFALPVCE